MEIDQIVKELQFKAVRSSGAGGQNVNKVASKVVLTFDLKQSQALTEEEKIVLENKLAIVIKRFLAIIRAGLFVAKERKATKIPKSAIRKRIKDKKSLSDIKQSRRKPDF